MFLLNVQICCSGSADRVVPWIWFYFEIINLFVLKCNSRCYPWSQIPLHFLRTFLLCTTFRNNLKPTCTMYLIGGAKFLWGLCINCRQYALLYRGDNPCLEVFPLQGRDLALISSYRRFGTTCRAYILSVINYAWISHSKSSKETGKSRKNWIRISNISFPSSRV